MTKERGKKLLGPLLGGGIGLLVYALTACTGGT